MKIQSLKNLSLFLSCSTILGCSAQSWQSQQSQQTYLDHAINASQVLLDNYYSPATGLFSNLWWNSAVMLDSLISLQALSPSSTEPTITEMLDIVFSQHQQTNFINGFYDDEGWWALMWLSAYDLTQNSTYLTAASTIWTNMKAGWRTQNCGGIWWDKQHTQENAIANVLFLSVSANLAVRAPPSDPNKAAYQSWAQQEWAWLSTSGMLDTSPEEEGGVVVIGGYNQSTCQVSGQGLTYTQGVTIGALLALDKLFPSSPEYLGNATAIADATIAYPRFTDESGIFTEPVGPFDDNTAQWKGIFLSNLVLLQQVAPKQAYVDFATMNADSIWSEARFENGTIGPKWDSDMGPVSASSQSSALAALLAAASMLDSTSST